ncbi:CEK5 ligand [Intoshia linei]|uniref:CEK5 ligand n=1 Tax=Intoshia linei TaxID=1819745 RepID=A0A177B3X3_9BILA|nr:CEK5 ligand [Intoshia linei]
MVERYTVMIFLIFIKFFFISTKRLPSVEWIRHNSLFKQSNTQPVIEVNMHDEINFICPKSNDEYYSIYQVTPDEFYNCKRLEFSKLIRKCKCDENSKTPYTFFFENNNPINSKINFHVGENYYFLTTSSGYIDGLDNLDGGACLNYNMKLTIHIKNVVDESLSVFSVQDALRINLGNVTDLKKSKIKPNIQKPKSKPIPLPTTKKPIILPIKPLNQIEYIEKIIQMHKKGLNYKNLERKKITTQKPPRTQKTLVNPFELYYQNQINKYPNQYQNQKTRIRNNFQSNSKSNRLRYWRPPLQFNCGFTKKISFLLMISFTFFQSPLDILTAPETISTTFESLV